MTKIKSISYTGNVEQQCIMVDSVDHLYITKDNIVTHNTIVCGTLTELAFFREAGKSDEFIMRFFNDMKGRIYSRMKSKTDKTGINFWGRSILDSSPNDLESPIDKYCSFEAIKDPLNMVIQGSQWEWSPDEYSDEELADRFPIFKGGSGKPPRILESPEGYDATEIVWVPRKLYQFFHDDLVQSLKNYAGIPQGNLDRLFYDYDKIEQCFIPQLKSLYYLYEQIARCLLLVSSGIK
jgi:hypothetical protein